MLDVLVDWGPVIGVAVLSQSRLGMDGSWTGSSLGLAATGLASALPLAWRRAHPLTVALAVGVVLLTQEFLVGGSLHFGSFCAGLIAMYSLGRHAEPPVRAAVGGLALAVMIAAAMGDEAVENPLELVFPLFYFSAAWLLGQAMRTLERRGNQLQELNTALERETEGRARLAVVNERIRLARELHDGVAHTVMLMVIQAEAAEETLGADPEATVRSLAAISAAGRHGLGDLRDLVDVLREPATDDGDHLPGLDEVPALCQRLRETGLEPSFTLHGDLTAVPPSVQASAYRVLQEAVTNVLKHSTARVVSVDIAHQDDKLTLEVTDPGPARRTSPGCGHGLAGMRERVDLHGGRIIIGAEGAGYRILAIFPSRTVAP